MIGYSKLGSLVTFLAVTVFPATALSAAEVSDASLASDDIMVAEFRGRPPYKRQRVARSEMAEMARFEETTPGAASERVWTTDFRGRPPYKRRFVSGDESVDLARFEETGAVSGDVTSDKKSSRRGAPGKLNSRR